MKYIKEERDHKKVISLIQTKPEEITGLLARYSRSKESLESLVEQFSKDSNNKLLKKVIDNYGHSSIRSMGYLTCGLEGISMIGLLDIFNRCPLQGGQERSTRYIYLEDSKNLIGERGPEHIFINEEAEEIYRYWNDTYNYLKEITYKNLCRFFYIKDDKEEINSCKLRTLDCIRYFIPLGILTQGGLIQSGREWSRLIKYLRSHSEEEFKIWGDLIEEVLRNREEGEGRNLIRHTEPTDDRYEELESIIREYSELYINNSYIEEWEIERVDNTEADIERVVSIYYPDIQIILNKISSSGKILEKKELIRKIGKWIVNNGNHHNELNNEFRAIGNYIFKGRTDIGTLTDINRHRGCLFLPILDPRYREINISKRRIGSKDTYEHLYCLPPYLEIEELKELRMKYVERFEEGFKRLENYINDNPNIDITKIKYLLPKGYRTSYYISLDINRILYLISLRSKVGGHISYRMFSYYLYKAVKREINLFNTLEEEIRYPDIYSKEEFLSRG